MSPGVSCNPPGRVGSGIGKTYELLKVDSESHQVQFSFKDARVHAPITCIKLGIPIYFIDHSEFITVQRKKILSRANNEIKCFEFSSIKRPLRPHLRTIIAI